MTTPSAAMHRRYVVTQAFRGWVGSVVDMLYPPVCVGCSGRHGAGADMPLCFGCRSRLPLIGDDACPRCGQALGRYTTGRKACPNRHDGLLFRSAVAVCRYDDVAAQVVKALKFGRDMRALEVMAPMLAERLAARAFSEKLDVVAPVPLHWRRRAWRRFNQAELIAERVAEALDLDFEPTALRRTRYTIPQAQLTPRARESNLRGAFAVRDPAAVRGARVLLVDDVMSTCATARECAHVLKDAGAQATYVGLFAR